jgi:hypothetical protein
MKSHRNALKNEVIGIGPPARAVSTVVDFQNIQRMVEIVSG